MAHSNSASSGRPLVVINGLGAPRAAAQVYGSFFRRHGFRVFTTTQAFLNIGDLRRSADRVHDVVLRAREQTGADRVSVVGLSLGGLIGLYYVKCGGGGELVDRFVSVGGPLNGSDVARVGELPVLRSIPALRQASPNSALVREVQAAPTPPGVRIHTLGTRGDAITPRHRWATTGIDATETPYGRFPFGHWYLYLHPGNYREVLHLLERR